MNDASWVILISQEAKIWKGPKSASSADIASYSFHLINIHFNAQNLEIIKYHQYQYIKTFILKMKYLQIKVWQLLIDTLQVSSEKSLTQ